MLDQLSLASGQGDASKRSGPKPPERPPEMVVRKLPAGPTSETPRYWFDDDPFITHLFNAISSMFPEGERFFIRAVGNYKDAITTPELKQQVRSFVQQEAQHFKEHDQHADLLAAQGFSVLERLNAFAKAGLQWNSDKMPRFALASTVATEHITAIFADRVLASPDRWLAPMVPEMKRLWRWHAIEESEHKAVAFDVYQECVEKGGRWGLWLRRLAMAQVVLVFFAETCLRHCLLLIKDGQFRPGVLWRGMKLLWGKQGLFRSFHPEIWWFFRRDFHPHQSDNAALVRMSIEELRQEGFAAA